MMPSPSSQQSSHTTSCLPLLHIAVKPLTSTAFRPFGDLILNPALSPVSNASSPYPPPTPANRSTALRHPLPASLLSSTSSYPPTSPRATIRPSLFCCTPQPLVLNPTSNNSLPIPILERHPFTTQTFLPLGAPKPLRYIIVVAPSLPSTADHLPSSSSSSSSPCPPLPSAPPPTTPPAMIPTPNRGPPDMLKAQAFYADGRIGVSYAEGTWHAPMICISLRSICTTPHAANGVAPSSDSTLVDAENETRQTLDFVVWQWMNGVAEEDCEEVDVRRWALCVDCNELVGNWGGHGRVGG